MRYISTLLISGILTFAIGSVYAADKTSATKQLAPAVTTITIYENPTTTSKVLTTVPQQQALITIFKQGDWLKIANPQNGMVGWVPKASLINATTVAVTQQNPGAQEYVITQKNQDGSTGSTYRVIQYSNSGAAANQLTTQQMQTIVNNIQLQQQKMRDDFNKMFNDAFQGFPLMPSIVIIQPQPNNTNSPTKK